MAGEISLRDLRNNALWVLRRVEAGERLRVTVNRRAVAELGPLPVRDTWVPRERAFAALVQADAGLRDDLDAALGGTLGGP